MNAVVNMTTQGRPVQSTDDAIDCALHALGRIATDMALPERIRHEAWHTYASLHACRSPQRVARMERDQGLRA